MGIKLFSHNETAYRFAVSMMEENGKAAVIHPTGTGKSFIAFKLCEEHPDRTVCWLSPSEYIFRTQEENFIAAGGEIPENIRFFTYAKLMLMSGEEIAEIRPDYIILDEFHRCGAEMWGRGVQNLLAAYPAVQVLGLSATSIRYLDNQRDMADELFEGNVASEMTLGEAIARGILAAPKYVISVYAYQKELKRYENRVNHLKTPAAKSQAEKYLEALRRALDKADGLDDVFARNMTDKTGKYLVFCANVRHMEELLSCCKTWFCKVDPNPHIYRAYSDDPQTSEAFKAFKEDDSSHLRLLFCIDMLNEGIHVEGLSGVILFRPTVSPIIYKQQIGRALTASGNREPIIFDIVNNFENLYSIGTIQAELAQAVEDYQMMGEGRQLVQDRFQIIDEVRESRQLFDALNEILSAPWEAMFARAREYFETHGNLNVPKRYKTEEGYSLGAWLFTQRQVRAGQQYGSLTPERIARLDSIGMIWENRLELAWERGYRTAKAYYEEHGNLLADIDYVSPDGYPLGSWLANQRSLKVRSLLLPCREEKLDEIGMVWSKTDYFWEQNFRAAEAYYRNFGNLDVPADYRTPEGVLLGKWIALQRQYHRQGRLSPEKMYRLDTLGIVWEPYQRQWEAMFSAAEAYYRENGDLEVPVAYRTPDGLNLGKWIRRQRDSFLKSRQGGRPYPEEQARRLERIGMVWEPGDPWEIRYRLAKAYYEEHGDLNVPGDYVSEGIWLGKWLNEQKQIYLGRRPDRRLTEEQISRLEAISVSWINRSEQTWEEQYDEAKRYFDEHGSLAMPEGYLGRNGKRLDLWVKRQRSRSRRGELSRRKREKISALGIQ